MKKITFYSILFLIVCFHPPLIAQQSTEEFCSRVDIECVEPEKGEYSYCADFHNGCSPSFSSAENYMGYIEDFVPENACQKSVSQVVPWTNQTQEGQGIIVTDVGHVHYLYGLQQDEGLSQGLESIVTYPDANGACVNDVTTYVPINRNRSLTCPDGTFSKSITGLGAVTCYRNISPPPKDCTADNTTAKPCQVTTGAKFRNEVDFNDSSLAFNRRYHSQSLSDNGLGKGWHNKYLKRLSVSSDRIFIIEGSGRAEPWRQVGGVWQGDADSDYLMTETATGFLVTDQRNNIEEYSEDGRLLSEQDAQGNIKTFDYDSENRLMSVTNQYGVSLHFTYSSNGKDHIVSVTDSADVQYQYEYDSNDNLVAVIFPDTTPDNSDNPRKIYHYEDARFPNHLTGITDENGVRHQTYAYDADGKAIESALAPTTNAVGQQRVQLNYQN